MNGEVHENLHENLHDQKKTKNSLVRRKTPAHSAREILRPTKHQIRGFMIATMKGFMIAVQVLPSSPASPELRNEEDRYNTWS